MSYEQIEKRVTHVVVNITNGQAAGLWSFSEHPKLKPETAQMGLECSLFHACNSLHQNPVMLKHHVECDEKHTHTHTHTYAHRDNVQFVVRMSITQG